MFDFSTLITDRTLADVRARNFKGTYDWRDFNRVSSAMEELVQNLTSYGYAVPGYSKGPVWTREDCPTLEQMQQYRDNIAALRKVLTLPVGTPEAPDIIKDPGYVTANDIEKILAEIDRTIVRVIKGMSRSNAFTFWSGNQPIPCAESNFGRTWEEFDAMQFAWKDLDSATWYLWAYGNPRKE